MGLHCSAKGLKSAIEDAFTQMREDDADGFDYEIGKVNGMKLRIVAEPEDSGCYDTLAIHGDFNFTAVVETERD